MTGLVRRAWLALLLVGTMVLLASGCDRQTPQARLDATVDELQASLAQHKAANPALPVVLKADAAAQYDKVMQVLEIAKRLDITEIGLATKRAQ